MKIVTVIGARPQFIKASPVSRALRGRHQEILVHTGQHYDFSMSQIFFDELEIPAPDVNLGVGSGLHGAQTAAMLEGIERVLLSERPDLVLVYGDTNSTMAGALAASKLNLRLAHVEAGLRSFNRRMPEEINRVVTDHLSRILLCPSDVAVRNLADEGIRSGVHIVGDVMSDALAWATQRAQKVGPSILDRLGLTGNPFLLCTVHRAENTSDAAKLRDLMSAMSATDETVIFPVHPRTRKAMEIADIEPLRNVRLVEPLGYMEMIALARSARMILTDSGGLQKEAYWLGIPCVTLREETEWIETVENGWNILVGTDSERIVSAVRTFAPPVFRPPLYGEGGAAERCVSILVDS